MRIFIYIFLFLTAGNISAQDTSLFAQATERYANQEYKAAIKDYKEILAQGKTSTAVYFNLANAHYKLGHIAPSIYFYNKALQLSPHDEDVLTNLMFAKQRLIDVIEPTPQSGWANFVGNVSATLSFNTWAVLGIIFSVAFLVFGLWYYFTPKTGKKRLFFTLSVLVLIFSVLSVWFAYQQFNSQQNKDFAIVFAKKIEVHVAPNPNSTPAFTLHEGTKVKVEDEFNDYAKIELADGTIGWIAQKAIKKL